MTNRKPFLPMLSTLENTFGRSLLCGASSTDTESCIDEHRRGQHILVLGASGRLGSEVVRQALDASHHVTTLVRSDRNLPFTRHQLRNPNLVIYVGSVLSRKDLDRVVDGKDVVINCLAPRHNWKGQTDISSRAQRLLNESMGYFKVKRLIIVRCHGTGAMDSLFTKLFSKKIHDDKIVQEQLIQENPYSLSWTIVRVGRLSNGKLTKNYMLDDKNMQMKISRADVAHFIIKEIECQRWINKTPTLRGESSGEK